MGHSHPYLGYEAVAEGCSALRMMRLMTLGGIDFGGVYFYVFLRLRSCTPS